MSPVSETSNSMIVFQSRHGLLCILTVPMQGLPKKSSNMILLFLSLGIDKLVSTTKPKRRLNLWWSANACCITDAQWTILPAGLSRISLYQRGRPYPSL